jgi:tetratricopeptide (TPR) repeat protein
MNRSLLALSAILPLSFGCGGQSFWLSQYEGHIRKGTATIAAAKTDRERSAGYVERARGYGEKARYLRAFKKIGLEEYTQLFEQAVKDHGEAVRLDPANAEVYLNRGLTYYDRGFVAPPDQLEPESKAGEYRKLAKADFTTAIELDGRNELALDRRGMINEQEMDYEAAILDYTAEMAVNPRLGKMRLADLYCLRGRANTIAKKYDLGAADYERAISLDVPADSCDCEPYEGVAGT